MRLLRYVLPALLLGAAFDLAQTALTRNGVGPFEYVTVALLEVLLVRTSLQLVRRARHRV